MDEQNEAPRADGPGGAALDTPDAACEVLAAAVTDPRISALTSELLCAPPVSATWARLAGADYVMFAAFSGPRTLALADLSADPMLVKLARLLGLLPPAGAPMVDNSDTEDREQAPAGATPPIVGAQVASMIGPRPTSGERMRVGGVLWPPGPLGVSAERVAHLVRMALDAPELRTAHDPGLSRSRLQRLLSGVPHNRALSGALMVWFHAADVLAPPHFPAHPFRTSRPLRADIDLAGVAERLSRTPLPTPEAVDAAFPKE